MKLNSGVARGGQGFTLIEVMVVVVLLSVLATLAVPSFAGWLERTRVRSAAEAIHSGIQLARAEAISRNSIVSFTLHPAGTWEVACKATSGISGCDRTNILHSRQGAEGRGAYTIKVNTSDITSNNSVDFLPHGNPDTSVANYIQQVDISAAVSADSASVSRALRVHLSPFGRTRLCYPHGTAGALTSC